MTYPSIFEKNGSITHINPTEARLRNLTYSSGLYVDVRETVVKGIGRDEVHFHKNVFFGAIPMMVRAKNCILEKDEGRVTDMGECELDPGGYFIINGSEKVRIIICMDALFQNSFSLVIKISLFRKNIFCEI